MEKVVLIVEDDAKNRKLVRDLLQVKGFATIEAENGKAGIEMAVTEQPDLILMDIQMPVMDGVEATRILKSHPDTREIPIVALTSYVMPGDEERMLKAGCDAYIAKPIDTRKFIGKVQEFLSE
jgi:CheY-like chemotaxis protein